MGPMGVTFKKLNKPKKAVMAGPKKKSKVHVPTGPEAGRIKRAVPAKRRH